jgi:hypothetical protein
MMANPDLVKKIRQAFAKKVEVSQEEEFESVKRRWEERESERQFLTEQNC